MNLTKWFQFIKPNLKFYKDGFNSFFGKYARIDDRGNYKNTWKQAPCKRSVSGQNNPFIKELFRYRKIDEFAGSQSLKQTL
jgi:hypothetical protein